MTAHATASPRGTAAALQGTAARGRSAATTRGGSGASAAWCPLDVRRGVRAEDETETRGFGFAPVAIVASIAPAGAAGGGGGGATGAVGTGPRVAGSSGSPS